MTSAVPYEPEDFDNNPFAENSVISSTAPAQEPEIPQEQHQQQKQQQHQQYQHHEQTPSLSKSNKLPPPPTVPDSNRESAETASNSAPHLTDPHYEPLFHSFPTEDDLKRYLPERLNKNTFHLSIKIQEIENNGNNTQKNPIFRFNAKVHKLSGFRRETYKDVRRTYKELEALYKYLTYNNIEVFVPSLPTISTLYNTMSPEFINTLTNSVQDWFNRICGNPILIKNQEFVLFLEQNDFGYTPSKTKPSSNSVIATGLKRKTLKQFQPPYDASKGLAEYRPMIKEIYLESQKLLERLEKLLKLQKQSSYYNNEFTTNLADMGALENDREMIRIWRKFDKVMSIFNEVDLIKDVSYISELNDLFNLISDDCYNIKESLTNRHLLMRELINAEETTKKRHTTISRLKTRSTIDPIKVDEAIRALELSNNYEKELKYQVKRTTYEMMIESKEYMEYLTSCIRKLFRLIAKQQIQQERRKLNLLLSNKLINPMDSLGRLGREGLSENAANGTVSGNGSNNVNTGSYKNSDKQDSWNSREKKKQSYTDDIGNNSDVDGEMTRVDAKSAATMLAGSSF